MPASIYWNFVTNLFVEHEYCATDNNHDTTEIMTKWLLNFK